MNKTSHDSEVPAPGMQVITACAFLHQVIDGEEKVFLAKRAETKKFLPGVYELPGGHIDYGEDIVEGLKREIKEEFGMEIEVNDPFAAFTYLNKIKGSHSIEVIYFAHFLDPIDKIETNPDDHSSFGWFNKEDIISTIVSENKSIEDPEIRAIVKGFTILDNS